MILALKWSQYTRVIKRVNLFLHMYILMTIMFFTDTGQRCDDYYVFQSKGAEQVHFVKHRIV